MRELPVLDGVLGRSRLVCEEEQAENGTFETKCEACLVFVAVSMES